MVGKDIKLRRRILAIILITMIVMLAIQYVLLELILLRLPTDYLFLILLLCCIAVGTGDWFLIEKTIVLRIIALSEDISNIGGIKDLSRRLVSSGNDEISHLAGEINSMLDRLEKFNDQLEKSKDDYKFLSFHDKLTGLYNRAYFEEELIRLDSLRQLPLSIIMADVNGLKLVNDTLGHLAGDDLLMKAARVLSGTCRQEDIIARWGGDEFIIILPITSEKQALQLCERIERNCGTSEMLPLKLSIGLGTATKICPEQDIQAVIKEAENRMYRKKLLEQEQIRSYMMAVLQDTLLQKKLESLEHIDRLKNLLAKMCEGGAHFSEAEKLYLLATTHDIGEIAVSEKILKKAGKLTKEEYELVKKHPEAGYHIARSLPELSAVAEGILSHHERWDGTGYPLGLEGCEIPLMARMFAIVDAYDAMTNQDLYQQKRTPAQAAEELKRCAGSQFDPGLVPLFLQSVLE